MDDGEAEDAEIARRSKVMAEGLAHGRFGRRLVASYSGDVPQASRKLSADRELELIARYRAGERTHDLAASLEVSVGLVYATLGRHGLKPDRQKPTRGR